MWSLTSLRTKRISSFRKFRLLPPKDFSTASVKLRSSGAQPRSPLCLRERTSSGPKSARYDSCTATNSTVGPLFNYYIGACKQRCRHREAKCLGGLKVDRKLEFGRCLNRKIVWFGASEDAVNIGGGSGI